MIIDDERPNDTERHAIQTVRAFLKAMESRDTAKAATFLHDDFSMTFPGAPSMTQLDDLISWSKPRYRNIGKVFDGVEASCEGAVVWVHGTLSGAWPDGEPFEGIRFVDRFELEDGRILRQDVWNDMALHGAEDGVEA
ncbi:nuclear transport factor 2 family protein [Jannaschia sp. LMIT008]|uniref:nuclear transport factor 2 family protein n=1 Tax=Jannaschia maritima TaxID=3032585 RepID=UPI0028112F0C|nr:nuclear transport factor 2 family protein [Jannaschia sp. LMIT008]